MLTAEENDLLTRTGPGTPMGELWRRFWLPVLVTDELPEADGPPVRVRLMSQDLVAFRDSAGEVGLLEARCPHRGASLFFGRNEEHGLRCVYHGWKFDRHGRCVDTPCEPPGSRLRENVRSVAYQCKEAGGFIWAYLGPEGLAPALPTLGFNLVPPTQRIVHKVIVYSNYLQALEGDVDPVHISILHGVLDGPPQLLFRERLRRGGGRLVGVPETAQDTAPKLFLKETRYGFALGARRDAAGDSHHWRISQFLMPGIALIPSVPGQVQACTIRVPIDDERSWALRCRWRDDRSFSAQEREQYETGGVSLPETQPDFVPIEHKDNDYLLDRGRQRASSVTGIKSISQQDRAVTESMGAISDRTKEHPGTSDRGVNALRQTLARAARQLQAGVEPAAAGAGPGYGVRAPQLVAPKSVSFEQLLEESVFDVKREVAGGC